MKPSQLSIEDGMIRSVATIPSSQCDSDLILCPGLIDLQVNGAGGILFNKSPDLISLAAIGETLARFGTTGWLATIVTDSIETMKLAADAVSQGIRDPMSGVKGIHFEGPHISLEKRGVHHPDYIRPLGDEEMAIYSREDLGVKYLTLAPEQVSEKQISKLVASGCVVSIGHTNADYEQTNKALAAGASSFTHLYNAMSGLSGREPGVIGSAFDSETPYGLIMDGIHVHPAMIQLAYRENPNLVLITDAMPPVGTDETSFQWYGQQVFREEDRLVDADGRLAGAYLTQNQAVKNAMKMLDVTFETAWHHASMLPAKVIGLDSNHAQIEAGAVADLVLIDKQFNVNKVWRAGVEIVLGD